MRVGVLTSGGDAPGMNAVVYGAYEAAVRRSIAIIGINLGFAGLVAGKYVDLGEIGLGLEVIARGGTLLGTSRSLDLRSDDAAERCVDALATLGLGGLIVIGGTGSSRGVERLRARTAIPIVFVPATIDNDVEGSDETIGFDSAVNYGVAAIDDLRVTAEALPHRAFLVEVLGADIGRLAEAIHEAAPVDAVMTPEHPLDLDAVASAMRDAMDRHYAIALMTEGCGEAGEMARRLGELMGARVRPSVLGHSQRGSRPSARDRHLGLMCGRAAIDMLATGAGGAVLVSKGVPLVQTVARRPRDPRGTRPNRVSQSLD